MYDEMENLLVRITRLWMSGYSRESKLDTQNLQLLVFGKKKDILKAKIAK